MFNDLNMNGYFETINLTVCRSLLDRIRPHKRLERKIGPRASQILNRFLEENGHTPVPFEVASLSAETNVHKDVIYVSSYLLCVDDVSLSVRLFLTSHAMISLCSIEMV